MATPGFLFLFAKFHQRGPSRPGESGKIVWPSFTPTHTTLFGGSEVVRLTHAANVAFLRDMALVGAQS